MSIAMQPFLFQAMCFPRLVVTTALAGSLHEAGFTIWAFSPLGRTDVACAHCFSCSYDELLISQKKQPRRGNVPISIWRKNLIKIHTPLQRENSKVK